MTTTDLFPFCQILLCHLAEPKNIFLAISYIETKQLTSLANQLAGFHLWRDFLNIFGALQWSVKNFQSRLSCWWNKSLKLKPFLVNIPVLYSLKTPENISFTGVSTRYKMGTLARNGLRRNAPNIPSETRLINH